MSISKVRLIDTHHVTGDNNLRVASVDKQGPAGAHHRYEVTGIDTVGNTSFLSEFSDTSPNTDRVIILFQNGIPAETGYNGLTIETLLAICGDRLECFQKGPFPSEYNQTALEHINKALEALKQRTMTRIARGVKDQHVK